MKIEEKVLITFSTKDVTFSAMIPLEVAKELVRQLRNEIDRLDPKPKCNGWVQHSEYSYCPVCSER